MAKLLILAALLIFSSKTEVSSVGTTTSPQQQNPQAGADKDPCEKGEIVNSTLSQTNWKQCVWKNLNDDRDSGKIKVQRYLENAMKNEDCSFNKPKSDTAIKVSFQGNMRVEGTSGKCNRWFFKFNGNECSGPMTIEAVVSNWWPSGNPNLLHHRSFEGYCENIPQGRVSVELWVGKCPSYPSYPLGDAHTGWNSVSRIMIEEVSRAQS